MSLTATFTEESPDKSVQVADVGIFSLLDPNKHGGLETYIRCLTTELQSRDSTVIWNGESPSTAANIGATWQPRIDRLLSLMTRKETRHLARGISKWQGRQDCSRAVQKCRSIHFVGTGWDLVGFPLVRAARNQGKIVTCWPAVHPGTWGDAPLDIDLYRQMDGVFAQSDHEVAHLSRLGVAQNKMVRCGCALPVQPTGDGYRFRRKHQLEGKELVLFIGRKTKEKGYPLVRHAVGKLAEMGRPIVLVSIGREVDSNVSVLPSCVDLDLGSADESTKQDALAACDVFALPSEAESFGIVYVEAWAYGKPVVCGTAPASCELVKRHQGGLACDGTRDDLLRKLDLLLGDSHARSLMGKRGQQAVADHYNAAKVVDKHLSVWRYLNESRNEM